MFVREVPDWIFGWSDVFVEDCAGALTCATLDVEMNKPKSKMTNEIYRIVYTCLSGYVFNKDFIARHTLRHTFVTRRIRNATHWFKISTKNKKN